jgi:hypothetical protein
MSRRQTLPFLAQHSPTGPSSRSRPSGAPLVIRSCIAATRSADPHVIASLPRTGTAPTHAGFPWTVPTVASAQVPAVPDPSAGPSSWV